MIVSDACAGSRCSGVFSDRARRRRGAASAERLGSLQFHGFTPSTPPKGLEVGRWRGIIVLCKGTQWADRLSRDLHGAAPIDSNGEDVEAGPLLRDKNGSRASGKLNGALASSFPAITERTVALPLDYYQVLGADTHFLADAIARAYESRVNNPPRDGFSQEALASRQEILRGACETLADPELRGEYNDSLVHDEVEAVMVDVPLSKVPGALCILQEVGEMEIVLKVGQDLLRERLSKSFQRDIVLVMSLAYVELSREEMAESPPGIVQSCEMLERALKLLQEEGGSSLAPSLQEQIDDTLQQINPRCMLELLALPLDKEHEGKREEGLQGIRSILWAVGEGGAFAPVPGFTREEFMKEAFARMTAAEQLALFTATPSNIPAESSEVYAVALAHVAEGFVAKKPRLIQEADTLFLQLQQTNSPLSRNRQLDFGFERGMCALLLGELDDCRAWLGLDDTDSPYRDPSIADFVYGHSLGSEDGDFLPGLCKLLESWLKEVVFPSFRETEELEVKLRDYYDDSGVLNYLEKLEKGDSPLAAAAAIVQLGVGAGAALDNVKTSALETLQKVFPLGKVKENAKLEDKIVDEVSGTDMGYARIQQHRETLYNNANLDASTGEHFTGLSSPSLGDEESQASGSDQIRMVSPLQIAVAGIVIGAVALGGWKMFLAGSEGLKLQKERTSLQRVPDTLGTVSDSKEVAPKMDARLAEHLVQKWQTAKALALGPSHAVDKLSEVLDGQMLKSWRERARDVYKNRWYYEYKLNNLSIESVTISMDGRKATVEATLQEAASMYDEEKLEITDSYESTYTTRYELVVVGGEWKISSGAVLRS